jgi:hypothetical protein
MDLETRSLERIHRLFEVLKLSIRLKLEYIKFDPDSLDDSEEDVRTNLRLLRRDFKRLLQIPTGRAQMGSYYAERKGVMRHSPGSCLTVSLLCNCKA